MRVFRGLPNAESRAPCALTIGNFDGVHRGHQALLAHVRAAADARGLPVCVMTFEPHPREFFNPAGAPPRIAMLRDKLEALRTNGVDRVVVEHFNHTFASQSPDTFVENIIVNGLHARWVMIGDDFRYGAKRAGDFASLKAAGEKYGFEVEQMATVAHPNGARISSSSRAGLARGGRSRRRARRARAAVRDQRARRAWREARPRSRLSHAQPADRATSGRRSRASSSCACTGSADEPLPAVASLGLRPTVDDSGRVLLEVFVLDWHGDAYGKLVRVEFLKKLRDEEKYVDLETLTAAIARDVAQRARLLRGGGARSIRSGRPAAAPAASPPRRPIELGERAAPRPRAPPAASSADPRRASPTTRRRRPTEFTLSHP